MVVDVDFDAGLSDQCGELADAADLAVSTRTRRRTCARSIDWMSAMLNR